MVSMLASFFLAGGAILGIRGGAGTVDDGGGQGGETNGKLAAKANPLEQWAETNHTGGVSCLMRSSWFLSITSTGHMALRDQ